MVRVPKERANINSGMAGVAKWLRHRFVVPVFGGSSPLVCPIFAIQHSKDKAREALFFCFDWSGHDLPHFLPGTETFLGIVKEQI